MEKRNIQYTSTNHTLTIIIDGKVYITDESNALWDELLEAVQDPQTDPEYLIGLLSPLSVTLESLKSERIENA